MTVDVEDYFQVQAFAHCIDRKDWEAFPRRVDRNTNGILDQFDAAGVKATFFTLGWVAERFPALIRRIVDDGHELASHGWDHTRVDSQDPEAFRQDIRRTRALLEDTGGVRGNRLPSGDVLDRAPGTMWAFPVLRQEGYLYSSSINPIAPRPVWDAGRAARAVPPAGRRRDGDPDDDGAAAGPQLAVLRRRLFPAVADGVVPVGPALGEPATKGSRGFFTSTRGRSIPASRASRTPAGNRDCATTPTCRAWRRDLDKLLRDFAWDRMDRVYAPVLAETAAA